MSETELFATIRSRLGPLLRPAGSGSSSDADVALFLDSLPGLAKSREGNLKIIEFYERIFERNIAEMELAEQMMLDGVYTPSAFRRATVELGDLFTPEDEAAMDAAQKPAQSAKPQGPINVVTGQPYVPPPAAGADVSVEAIGRMQQRELMMLDTTKMSPAQRQGVINRMMQLGM